MADLESTRPEGSPLDWTDEQREEWGYEIKREPEAKGGRLAQDTAVRIPGKGKEQELENLKDALRTAERNSKTHESNITNLVESTRPEGIPRWNAGNWEQG